MLKATRRGFVNGVQTMDVSRIYSNNRKGSLAAPSPCATLAADLRVAQYLAEAAAGDARAFFDLGVTFSTCSDGVAGDLIEAHKWFNLAVVAGHDCAQGCRADISEEMTSREIAEAQRRAREWIAATSRRAS